MWTNSGITDLGVISGQDYSVATAIDRSGDVVGVAGLHAALWRTDGTFLDLGTLPGNAPSEAIAISGGRIVGWSNGAAGLRAFLWTKGKGMQNLGVLPGGTFSVANAVRGRYVLGNVDGATGFLWTPEKGMQNLNDLVVNRNGQTIVYPNDINGAGQITGVGWLGGGYHAFLLTPVP